MGDCIHEDCKYRAFENRKEYVYKCNYLSCTGRSRLMWHIKRGLDTDPAKCKCYEKGKKITQKFQLSLKNIDQ